MQYEPYQKLEQKKDISEMSDVERAVYFTDQIVSNRLPKVGNSVEVALEQLASEYALGFSKLRSFWHPSRRPKTVGNDGWLHRLHAAYLNECRVSLRRFQHKLEVDQKLGRDDDLDADLLAEVETLLAKIEARSKAKIG